jgi:Arc/MetJ-type ribon-helix-helix transcriptional regulator
MDKLVGQDGLYPSRSELIRVAVRQFLIKELKLAKQILDSQKPQLDKIDEEKYVRVPFTSKEEGKEEPVREFKTYKIVKKLKH